MPALARLGLATPTSLLVGTGKGAELGILIRRAEALEVAGATDLVVLDKTGTITRGQPEVTDVVPAPGVREEELLRLAASLEQLSEHPLGQAVVRRAAAKQIALAPVADFRAHPGLGVEGEVEGRRLTAGAWRQTEACSGDTQDLQQKANSLEAYGKTVMVVCAEGALLGLLALQDTPAPEAAEAVARLKRLGLRVAMLTGDNPRTAQAVGQAVGIDEVRAHVRPDEKAAAVREFQQAGHQVAMVGDGLNDAPALAQANLGMALGYGTDVAMEAADITLVRPDLRLAPEAIRLSRATLRNIRQNLFWAFLYNVIGIPIAAGVLYPIWHVLLNPAFAAAAMAFSSVSVVTNALRLRHYRAAW